MITDTTLMNTKVLGAKIKKNIDDFDTYKCHYFGVYLNDAKSNPKTSKLHRLYIDNLPIEYESLPMNYSP